VSPPGALEEDGTEAGATQMKMFLLVVLASTAAFAAESFHVINKF
jgi:hypothetical protein